MTHHNPSVQSQFMAALLAFTMLAYANVWFIKLETRGIFREPSVESAAPDLSRMSREEVGKYLVREVQRQLASPDQYLAKILSTTDALPLPASTPTPSPTPQQFERACNRLVQIGQSPFSGGNPLGQSFVAPRASAGAQSANEFYLVNSCLEGSLCSLRLGSDGLSLGRMDILFSGVQDEREVHDTSASDRFIAYLVALPQEQADILVVRYIGANGVPDGPGGDDVTHVILDTRQTPGIFFPGVSGRRVDIAGNKLAFLVQYGPNPQQRHIITMDFAANGTPTGNISVPTASSVMRYPTANHQIWGMQVGGSGAVALQNFDTSARFVSVVDLLSPGLDGQWGNFDDQRWTGGGSSARSASSFDFSETGQYLVFSVADNRNPNIPIDLEFEDTGSDLVPNTTDDNSGFFTPVGTNNGNGIWGNLSVGDFIPSPPLVRPSAVRVTGIYVNPSGIWIPYFIEADADNQLNMQPNKEITLSLGGHYSDTYSLASEQNVSLFVYSSQLQDTLFGIRWCYQ